MRIIVGLETQVPYHSPAIFRSFLGFIADWEPHKIVGIGDHLDCPAPARWNRGTATEYATNLQSEIDIMRRMFSDIRFLFDGEFTIHKGNHEQRIDVYARTKAPAFAGLHALQVSSLLDYAGFEITELPTVAQLAPNWVTTHGDSGRVSPISGGTAMALARRYRKSVICGHTHRLGVLNESFGMGARQTLTGVETGHMMAVKKAAYIKTGAPNWQAGWVAVEVSSTGLVNVSLVNVSPAGKVNFHG